MNKPPPNTVDSALLMLKDLGATNINRDSPCIDIYPQEALGEKWTIISSVSELESYASHLDETATYLGLGGRYSPGVALMSIHLQETIATAPPECARQIQVVGNRFEVL